MAIVAIETIDNILVCNPQEYSLESRIGQNKLFEGKILELLEEESRPSKRRDPGI